MKYLTILLLALTCVSCCKNDEQDLHFGPGPEDEAHSVNRK